MEIEQLLVASIGPAMLAAIAMVVRAFLVVRFQFERFLRHQRPEVWSELAPGYSRLAEAVTSGSLGLDATEAVTRFRRAGYRETSDPELAMQCERANRAERLGILSVFALFAWGIVVFAGILILKFVWCPSAV